MGYPKYAATPALTAASATASLPFISSRTMQNLLFGLPGRAGFFAVHADGGFGAYNCANAAAGTAFRPQCGGVISLGGDVIVSKRQHFLGTRGNTYLAALAVQLVYFDSSLNGHSYLLRVFAFTSHPIIIVS